MYPDWQQEVAAGSALRLGLYRPGRHASRVRIPLLVVACDDDRTAPPGPAIRAARRAPFGELARLRGGHYAPFLRLTNRRPIPKSPSCVEVWMADRPRGLREAAIRAERAARIFMDAAGPVRYGVTSDRRLHLGSYGKCWTQYYRCGSLGAHDGVSER